MPEKIIFLDVIKSNLVVNNVMLIFICYLTLQIIRLFYLESETEKRHSGRLIKSKNGFLIQYIAVNCKGEGENVKV